MRALGFDPTDAEVQKMAAEAGHKDSSAITFEEIVEMVGKKYVSFFPSASTPCHAKNGF